MSIILTVEEIRDLAIFAGLSLEERIAIDLDELETEFTIAECGEGEPYRLAAWVTDYPEEGAYPLGHEREQS